MTTTAVLGGYPAKQCARAVHNDHSPASPPKPGVDDKTQRLFDAGNEFEARVNQRLADAGALLLASDAPWSETIEATMDAMRAGAPVIVNGRLPRVGSMAGAPDVLVRVGDGYVPVDIKLHGTRKDAARRSAWFSSLGEPARRRRITRLSDAGSHQESDGFQLAHYTRMLQHLGLHAGEDHLVGGIIGQSDYSDVGGDPWLVAWYDLRVPRRATYSASAEGGRARRSLLERYDHEFAFRLLVADTAKSGGELVRPFHIRECNWCVWSEYCSEVAGADDASFAIHAGLPTAQQWRFLYDRGITTTSDLADQDPETCPPGWGPRDSQPGATAQHKYSTLVRRARLARAGLDLEPLGDWPEIPSGDVEIDFDIEWDFENRIYLWGMRVRDGQDDATAVFDPVESYEPLDVDGAEALAARFAQRLGGVIATAEAAGKTVQIFHWAHPERSMTAKYPAVAELLEGRAFDLHAWFDAHFLTRDGSSIKAVAPIFDFHWDVEDAGGAESQLKIARARAGGPEAHEAREWLYRYNQSDVAAQAAIRDGLRTRRDELSPHRSPAHDRVTQEEGARSAQDRP